MNWCMFAKDGDRSSLDHRAVWTSKFSVPMGTPVRESLDIWPPFPVAIQYHLNKIFTFFDKANLLAALAHHGRIRQVYLSLTSRRIEEVAAVMQQPFPELTHLDFQWEGEGPPALPSGFLGGSAPCLQHLHLDCIRFPEMLMFLSSTSNLVNLHLHNIPQEGYVSPEAMVAGLAGLPMLQSLFIGFLSDTSLHSQISPPPVTRTLLPALTSCEFRGASEYLEEFVSRIDSPRLNQIYLRYTYQLIDFQVAQLFQFLDRSEDPKLTPIWSAKVQFARPWVSFDLYPQHVGHLVFSQPLERGPVCAFINCQGIERQISRIAQVFSQPSAILSGVVYLELSLSQANADRHGNEWLRLLRQFSAIRTLHISGMCTRELALVLDDVTAETVAEVLPVLELICIDGQPVSCIEKFLAARRFSDQPVTIVETEAELYESFKPYVI